MQNEMPTIQKMPIWRSSMNEIQDLISSMKSILCLPSVQGLQENSVNSPINIIEHELSSVAADLKDIYNELKRL